MLLGCGDPKLCPTPVVDPGSFTIVRAEGDPFEANTSTSTARCGESDTLIELLNETQSLSINTSGCNRLTVETPLMQSLSSGESISIRIWHFALFDYQPTTGVVAVAFDDETIWSQEIQLPTESGLLVPSVAMSKGVPSGTMVRWHVANHGSNSWNFVELTAMREGDCQ